jgi:CspA family cold shock protein
LIELSRRAAGVVNRNSFWSTLLGAIDPDIGRHNWYNNGYNKRNLRNMATGTVKFFNSEKGFGFIAPSNGHYSKVVGDGYRALQEGQQVEFDVAQGRKGLEAQNVRAI